jgi:hypothetical protein
MNSLPKYEDTDTLKSLRKATLYTSGDARPSWVSTPADTRLFLTIGERRIFKPLKPPGLSLGTIAGQQNSFQLSVFCGHPALILSFKCARRRAEGIAPWLYMQSRVSVDFCRQCGIKAWFKFYNGL